MKQGKRGMTLYEILVTVALFALLTSMVTVIFVSSIRFHTQGMETTKLRQKASAALDVITGDILESSEMTITGGGSGITLLKTDVFKSNSCPMAGGDYSVTYRLLNRAIRRETADEDFAIATNVTSLVFEPDTGAAPFNYLMIILEMESDGPTSPPKSITLSTDVFLRSSKATPTIFSFGP